MAYETLLNTRPPDYEYDYRGDALSQEDDGPLARPYLNMPVLHEAELGIYPPADAYDPLTAPLSEVVAREYVSEQAYQESPATWGQQAEAAHHKAFTQTTALRSMRRVCEYRAQQPVDTDTMQLRLVSPEPSSVDVVLAELRDLRAEIAIATAHPPMFSAAQSLRTKQYPAEAAPVTGGTDGGDPVAAGRKTEHSGEASMSDRTRMVGRSKEAVFVPDESSAHAPLWRIAWLSARGAKQLLGRIKRQAARI